MLRRWLLLALIAVVVTGVLVAGQLNSDSIARMLAPEFVPLSEQQVKERAEGARASCGSRPYWMAERCDLDYVRLAREGHLAAYEYDISGRAREVRSTLEGTLAGALALLGLAALWALCRALYTKFAPVVRAGTRLATSSLDGGVSEVMQRRRFNKAEKDFQTLKSLYENGLITEDVFNQRKDLLTQTLREAAK